MYPSKKKRYLCSLRYNCATRGYSGKKANLINLAMAANFIAEMSFKDSRKKESYFLFGEGTDTRNEGQFLPLHQTMEN